MSFNESQSHAALRRLMVSRGITESEISEAVADEIASIESRLSFLRGEPWISGEVVTADPFSKTPTKGKRPEVSPQQAESRRVQGVYLSLIRRVPKTRRAQYQAIAKQSGREAAIEAMRAR